MPSRRSMLLANKKPSVRTNPGETGKTPLQQRGRFPGAKKRRDTTRTSTITKSHQRLLMNYAFYT